MHEIGSFFRVFCMAESNVYGFNQIQMTLNNNIYTYISSTLTMVHNGKYIYCHPHGCYCNSVTHTTPLFDFEKITKGLKGAITHNFPLE